MQPVARISIAIASTLLACGQAPPAGPDGAVVVDGAEASTDAGLGALLLREDFSVDDTSAWPAGWSALGGVDRRGIASGRAWLTPTVSSYSLGRMGHGLASGPARDVEVTFRLAMDDPGRQGVGFYVRQNGGYLTGTTPRGSGYAVFAEAFAGAQLGLWRERDGLEEPLVRVAVAGYTPGRDYWVRFRCAQEGGATHLAARVWPADAAEPSTWTVEATDATPALQGAAGAIAVDGWNTATPGKGPAPARIYVDEITVRAQ
jgi:hypothetical protein